MSSNLQICKTMKSKLFREIAGNRYEEWEALYINSFIDLQREELKKITNSEKDDFEYFHARWMRLRTILDIKEDEKRLHRMYKNCIEKEYSFEQAFDIQIPRNVTIAMTVFAEYNQKISQIRSESIYYCDWNQYCME
jgi:hypothetical protein